MTLYDKVKRLADEQKISIRSIEIKAGLANGTIGKWRENKPFVDSIKRVSEVLGVKIEDLL